MSQFLKNGSVGFIYYWAKKHVVLYLLFKLPYYMKILMEVFNGLEINTT